MRLNWCWIYYIWNPLDLSAWCGRIQRQSSFIYHIWYLQIFRISPNSHLWV